jgi:hypothetical protein
MIKSKNPKQISRISHNVEQNSEKVTRGTFGMPFNDVKCT